MFGLVCLVFCLFVCFFFVWVFFCVCVGGGGGELVNIVSFLLVAFNYERSKLI